MIVPRIPENEQERLAAVMDYRVLDSAPEPALDEVVALIVSACDAPIGVISIVDADRQWFKSIRGLEAVETSRDVSFCAHAILQPDRLMVVPDASADPRFAANPLVTGGPKIRFYAGTPLVTADGFALGTLCIIDTKARAMSEREQDALRVGGRAVMTLLEQRRTIWQLRSEIRHRCQIEEQLCFSSSHDGLTQLPNRAEFGLQVEAALARLHSPAATRFAVCFIDLDRFKQVNDTLGHLAGDALLVEVGRRLNAIVRFGDAVARLGGDEFTLLIDGAASGVTAAAIGRRIAAALASKVRIGGSDVRVTASIGVCLVDASYGSVEDVLRDADIAMYASKDLGRNRCTVFTPQLRAEFASANALHETLCQALEDNQFRLAYQPIVSLQREDAASSGFEALLRLKKTDGQLQSAVHFIETAEQTGLIVELGDWVLREACAQAARWQRECADPVVVAVNVSAKQLAEPDFVARVKTVISESSLDPSLLALELTESILIVDVSASLEILRELRAFGLKIYLDDFGTGYSSLSYLREFPVDRIKIDRSFVSGGAGDGLTDPLIVGSIISLAHKLNVEVVAEGVETEIQRAALAELGCDWAQGFLFSPAIPAAQASSWLGRWNPSDMSDDTAA